VKSPEKPLTSPEQPLVSFIIPIFNEVLLIETVLRRVRALPLRKELILVDDCSVDGTQDILEGEKSAPDTIVLRHEKNRGKGAAIRTGLAVCHGDIVLIQDADLEYNPEEIPPLLLPIMEGRTNVVFGSRFMGSVEGMRLPNRVANFLLAAFVSLFYGHKLTDEATAYKVFKGDLIRSIPLRCERFEFCPEITAKILRRGERIIELPVTFEARTFAEGKKIGWWDFVEAVWTLGRYRFWRDEKPPKS
jgi:glycosyltransferase involved in cell wall biosynthesis